MWRAHGVEKVSSLRSRRFLPRPHPLEFLLPLLLLELDQPVRHVIPVDVGDVGDRLRADAPGCDQLDVVAPHVGVEALLRRLRPEPPDPARSRVVGGEREQRLVQGIDRVAGEVLVDQLSG